MTILASIKQREPRSMLLNPAALTLPRCPPPFPSQQAGRWKLGASLQNFARSMMPAGNRVAADVSQPAAGPGLRSGRGDGGDTSDDGEEVIDKVGSRLGPHKAG